MTLPVCIYCRFSPKPHKKSRTQAQHDEPIEVQLEACRRYCAHMGLVIGAEFCEPGVSGYKSRIAERPEGQRLLAALATGQYSGVVVMRLDRLSRRTTDILLTVEQWDEDRIALHLANQSGNSINSSTPEGKMFLTILASFAEYERGMIASRTSIAMRKQFHETVQTRGHRPYGRRVSADGVTLEDDPHEKKIIAKIVEYNACGLNCQEIAETLDGLGYTARNGKTLYPQLVRKIIEREGRLAR